jgi:FkbM family methyltransferase
MPLLARIMKRFYRSRRSPVLARRHGCTFLLDPRNWIDNRLLAGAPYEDEQLAHARRLVAEHRLDTVIDIGANFGLYSCVLGRMDEVRTVYAFEPARRNFCQLMGNVFANDLQGKVRAFDRALGAETATAVLHIDPTSTGISRLNPAGSHRRPETWRQREEVEIARFDDLVSAQGLRAFVKIDVEGEAAAVLDGMRAFLQHNAAAIQVEISPAEVAVHRILGEAGYRQIGAIGPDVIFGRGLEL